MELRYYSVYGHTFSTTCNLDHLLAPGNSAASFHFEVVSSLPDRLLGKLVHTSPRRLQDGRPSSQIYQFDDLLRFIITGVGVYDIKSACIVACPEPSMDTEQFKYYLLGAVFALWLELHGTLALHASATVIDGKAVAFLASSGVGKSTLAAKFMQAGYPLLTDDILAVKQVNGSYMAQPGYPITGQWSEGAESFFRFPESPARKKYRIRVDEISDSLFYGTPAPLSRVYLLARQFTSDEGIADGVTDMLLRDAVIHLISKSFLTFALNSLGYSERRFVSITHLARSVPVKRLYIQDGYEFLDQIICTIIDDLNTPLI